MKTWKQVLFVGFMLASSSVFAGVQYDCNTNGVPLSNSEGKQVSSHKQNEVRITFASGANGNLIVGDHHFILWYKTSSVAVLAKGQEGMLLRRVLPLDQPVEIELDVNYLGERKQVRCEVRNI